MNRTKFHNYHFPVPKRMWDQASTAQADIGYHSMSQLMTQALVDFLLKHKESLTDERKRELYGDQ